MDTLFRWSKLISPEEEEEWENKLIADDVSYSIESLIKRKNRRIAVFCEEKEDAETLKKRYGGGVTEILPEHWEPSIDPSEARVLKIRDRFIVSETDDRETLDQLQKENPGKEILSFPPQLAFGTGGHPTTANCLRLLVDAAPKVEPWTFLDLGCGSGILSVAAAKLGAKNSLAVELDPMALDYARQNAERHKVDDKVGFLEEDVTKWLKFPPKEPYSIIAANLFSDLLIEILPLLKTHGWLREGGDIILSGFLTSQASDVNQCALENGFKLQTFLRRGKWVAAGGIFANGAR